MTENDERPPELNEGKRSEWAISDFLKRTLLAGVGAVFMTEEGIRSMLSDLKLPKEAIQFALSQVAKTKQELFKVVSQEIRSFLESTQLADELRKLLTQISLEISTKVRFVDEADSIEPRAKASIKVKRDKPANEDTGDGP
ncbi:MAG: hypothetical protein JXR96_00855 [Deltaproteobacteria bacterium]|nr:hypothetical protein [Deltaproteobacteria bacterium]